MLLQTVCFPAFRLQELDLVSTQVRFHLTIVFCLMHLLIPQGWLFHRLPYQSQLISNITNGLKKERKKNNEQSIHF